MFQWRRQISELFESGRFVRSLSSQFVQSNICWWQGRWASSFAVEELEQQEHVQASIKNGDFDLKDFPPSRVRNFSIIAHIDHGKSTLADRLMQYTGAIQPNSRSQYLDKLQVERERGITVKAQTASLVYRHMGDWYLLNLIDTPGHVDFNYEVSRSLSACQGAILLVDATQGIQAQTMANFYLAFDQNLTMLPILNKMDMPAANSEKVCQELELAFDMQPEEVLLVSAKTGLGIQNVLPAVIKGIDAPQGQQDGPLRLLLFDAYYDDYRGVICLIEVVDGQVSQGQKIQAFSSKDIYEVSELGVLCPEAYQVKSLYTGQVGYMVCGMKSTRSARVGDTFSNINTPITPMPGFKPAKAMLYAGMYPVNSEDFENFCEAMEKLTLNDASVVARRENSPALGAGYRAGFLGVLHMDVFMQRLEQEHNLSIITTAPSVPFQVQLQDGQTVRIEDPRDWPEGRISKIFEPTVNATLIVPDEYTGKVIQLCQERRADLIEHTHLGGDRNVLKYVMPSAELASNFYSQLKGATSGYASFDYEEGDMREAELVKLDVLVCGDVVEELARIVPKNKAQEAGRQLCAKMREQISRQQFEVPIQASAGGKILARETLKALRKDVMAKCYGGDISRKRKLLDKQKEGKKRLKKLGKVDVPQDAFQAILKSDYS